MVDTTLTLPDTKPIIESKHFIVDMFGCEYSPSNIQDDLVAICGEARAKIKIGPKIFTYDKENHAIAVIEESHAELVYVDGSAYLNFFTCGDEANPDRISPTRNSFLRELFKFKRYNLPSEENRRKKNISFSRGVATPSIEDHLDEKGQHIIIDVVGCDSPEYINNMQAMKDLLASIYSRSPEFVECEFVPQGITAVLTEKQRTGSVHTWPEKSFAAFDFVSYNGPIEVNPIVERLLAKLKPKHLEECGLYVFDRSSN